MKEVWQEVFNEINLKLIGKIGVGILGIILICMGLSYVLS